MLARGIDRTHAVVLGDMRVRPDTFADVTARQAGA